MSAKMRGPTIRSPEERVEDAVAQLFSALWVLEAVAPREAFDNMGTIISMLADDRAGMIKKGLVNL